jgi:hypothetical protein
MDKPTIRNEYAALDFDGTERRANYRTVAYRIDILHLCERKDAAAILYEIIYRWQTEVRKPEIVKEIERRKKASLPSMTEDEVESVMWVWMSYNDFVRESGGAVAYNTVIRMLDYLVEDAKIVECRENHDPRYPDYEYRIRLDTVKSKLKALPATPAFLPKVPKKKSKQGEESTQVGTVEKRSTQKGRRAQASTHVGTVSTQVGTVSTQKGIATTQDGREVYPDGGTSHTTTHTSHIEHTKEGTGNVASSLPTPAPSQDYHPDFSANQEKRGDINGHTNNATGDIRISLAHPDSGSSHVGEHPQYAAAPASRTAPAQQQAATIGDINGHAQVDRVDPADSTRTRNALAGETQAIVEAELSTLARTSPQASAKLEPRPMSRAAHIDFTFQWLDAVRKRASGDPMASYVANGANKKRVADLIDATAGTANEVSQINVALAWMALWNAGQWRDGKSWQDPGMLTVKAFCDHYGESLDRARAKPQRKKPAADAPVNFTQLRLAAEAKARAQGAVHG